MDHFEQNLSGIFQDIPRTNFYVYEIIIIEKDDFEDNLKVLI